MSSSSPKRILFLCTGNSCRSHMGEGLLRMLAGDRVESLSAGAKPAGYVHPKAIEVMTEIGCDISAQTSKPHRQLSASRGHSAGLDHQCFARLLRKSVQSFRETCPRLHWPFDDPAHATGTDEEIVSEFRRVRDEIRTKLEAELANILD